MRLSLSDHKLPIGVTSVGLLVATALAVAPVLMADSATDVLAANNAGEIEKLTTTLQQQSDDLDQRVNSRTAELSGKLNNLDSQVVILNKAVKNIFKKSRNQANTTNAALDEITNGPRLVNLEKAVSNLHRKQNNSSDSIQASLGKMSSQTDNRLNNLEKAVKRLHLRQKEIKSVQVPVSGETSTVTSDNFAELEVRLGGMEREFRDVFTRVAVMETTLKQMSSGNTVSVIKSKKTTETTRNDNQSVNDSGNRPDNNAENRIAELEQLVWQLQNSQEKANRRSTFDRSGSRRSSVADTRVERLERVIARMDRRLNSMETSAPRQEEMIDQLYEIQDYIDEVLDQLNR